MIWLGEALKKHPNKIILWVVARDWRAGRKGIQAHCEQRPDVGFYRIEICGCQLLKYSNLDS